MVSAVFVVVAALVRQRCSTAMADCGELVGRQSAWSATRTHDAVATAGFLFKLAAAVGFTLRIPRRGWRFMAAASLGTITLAMTVARADGRGWADAGAAQRAFVLMLSAWLVLPASAVMGGGIETLGLGSHGGRLDLVDLRSWRTAMDIVRNDDGTLVVPVTPERGADVQPDDGDSDGSVSAESVVDRTTTRVLHPGEGGYDEALVEWDAQQHPDRDAVVSTAAGRQEAMGIVHAVAEAPDDVSTAVEALEDPDASGDALRHVLVGGVHSVEDFATEVSEAEGGEPLPAHTATKIIGQVLAELDS